jgi:hypothetical protein
VRGLLVSDGVNVPASRKLAVTPIGNDDFDRQVVYHTESSAFAYYLTPGLAYSKALYMNFHTALIYLLAALSEASVRMGALRAQVSELASVETRGAKRARTGFGAHTYALIIPAPEGGAGPSTDAHATE